MIFPKCFPSNISTFLIIFLFGSKFIIDIIKAIGINEKIIDNKITNQAFCLVLLYNITLAIPSYNPKHKKKINIDI